MDAADADLAEGRSLTLTNLLRIVAVSAVLAARTAPALGAAAWLRLAVIALVCVLVYRGIRGALWVLGALTVFAGVGLVVVAMAQPALHWSHRLLSGVLGTVQVLAFVILLKAPEVQRFMERQRTGVSGEPMP